MRDLGRVLFPEPTSFPHVDNWTRFDLLNLLKYSPLLSSADEQNLINTGRSLVADAFYALSGQTPNGDDVLGANWSRLMAEPSFPKMPKDYQEQVAVVLSLAGLITKQVFEHQEEIVNQQDEQAAEQVQDGNLETGEMGSQPGDGEGQGIVSIGQVIDAEEQGKEMLKLARSLQGGIDGASPALVFDKAMTLTTQFDLDLFANILGWAEQYAGGAARENREGSENLTGFCLGGWSDNVDVYDMIRVAQGDPTALIAFSEESLSNYEYDSQDPMGRGAVIVMQDQSTSMLETTWGGKTKYQVALTMEVALASVMQEQRRDLMSMCWSDKVERYDRENTKCGIVPRVSTYTYGEPGIEQHLRTFLRGGTSIIPALEAAIKEAEQYAEPCDILIISDMEFNGDDATTRSQAEAIVEEYRANGGRVWGIFVGSTKPTEHQVGWMDGWVHSNKLTASEEAGKIIAAMVRNVHGDGKNEML